MQHLDKKWTDKELNSEFFNLKYLQPTKPVRPDDSEWYRGGIVGRMDEETRRRWEKLCALMAE